MNTRCLLEIIPEVSNIRDQIPLQQGGVLKLAAPDILLDIVHHLEQRVSEEVGDPSLLVLLVWF